jgi:pyruvate/2-oxoglutarate dehydrogenase complex dihydrolipoamide acyltransferase (E2) component
MCRSAGSNTDVVSRSAKIAGEPLKVPIMGEGIRDARVVSLLKQPGDPVKADEALCEVETEKAVYPIEAAAAGTFVGWKTKIDDTVLVGQVIGVLAPEGVIGARCRSCGRRGASRSPPRPAKTAYPEPCSCFPPRRRRSRRDRQARSVWGASFPSKELGGSGRCGACPRAGVGAGDHAAPRAGSLSSRAGHDGAG